MTTNIPFIADPLVSSHPRAVLDFLNKNHPSGNLQFMVSIWRPDWERMRSWLINLYSGKLTSSSMSFPWDHPCIDISSVHSVPSHITCHVRIPLSISGKSLSSANNGCCVSRYSESQERLTRGPGGGSNSQACVLWMRQRTEESHLWGHLKWP